MKTFSELYDIFEQIKRHKTPEELAKKHKVSLSSIEKQLKIGISIEKEHTNNKHMAMVIASQHLDEIPDYYTRLKKVESKSVSEGTLHHWYKGSKSKGGKPGWVQADGSPCANEPGETKTPKCFSSGRLAALRKKGKLGKSLIRSAVSRKRKEDKYQQKKSGGSSPTYVSTFSKGKKDPNYIKAEPGIKESIQIKEGKKDIPGKGSGTKDECYYKVKSRFKVWPSAYACVPENGTKALTRDGWKTVNELVIGEDIMTFNLHKNELEFKPILNLHRYKNANTSVIRSGNTGFIFESTDNHNWVVNDVKTKTNRSNKYKKIEGKYLLDTKSLIKVKKNKNIITSAVYKGGGQTKKNLIYKYGDNWIKYILDISEEQRQSWLFSSLIYDGNQQKIQRKSEKPELVENLTWNYTNRDNRQSFRFKQKDIMHRDAFLLSAYLNGGSVTWNKPESKNIYTCHYISNKTTKNCSNFKIIKENITDVWCPETENGTWVMSQEINGNGIITITGNSGALVKCRKAGASNWGKSSNKKIDEAYTRIQETGNTYTIMITWMGKPKIVQMFFPNLIRPTKKEVSIEINKLYPNATVLSYKISLKDPTKPYLFAANTNDKSR